MCAGRARVKLCLPLLRRFHPSPPSPACLPACLPVCLSACFLAFLLSCFLAFLLSVLLAFLLVLRSCLVASFEN